MEKFPKPIEGLRTVFKPISRIIDRILVDIGENSPLQAVAKAADQAEKDRLVIIEFEAELSQDNFVGQVLNAPVDPTTYYK